MTSSNAFRATSTATTATTPAAATTGRTVRTAPTVSAPLAGFVKAAAPDVARALAAALSGIRPGDVAYLLVDVENMCLLGTGDDKYVDEAAFAGLVAALGAVAGPDVRVVYGYSHHWAPRFRFELPAGRHLWRSGDDGGESVVIDAVAHEGLPTGTTSLVVLSGDGRFTDLVAAVGATGTSTTVAARTGTLSRRLALAAHRSVTFGEHPATAAAAATEGGGHLDAA